MTNHFYVLASISQDPARTVREIAARIGFSERATAAILSDLERDGYLSRRRVGRRSQYTIHRQPPLRSPIHAHRTIGELLDFLDQNNASAAAAPPASQP